MKIFFVMFLSKLSLLNYKNYEQVEISPSSKINCFIGNNGVGKTNLIDAIYYLSFCKSYFNPIDNQNIKHGEQFFVIQGLYDNGESTDEIYCGIKRNQKKQFKRNKKEYTKLSNHIGLIPLVMVSPADIKLIVEGSEDRRNFINSVISQYDKPYLDNLINYNRALKHRNNLLKSIAFSGKFDADSIDVWDEQLVRYGIEIYKKRIEYINEFIPIFQKYYNFIAPEKEKVVLEYNSHLHDNDFYMQLKRSFEKDKILQYTTVGVHKDDLNLLLSDYPINKIGSQGQQKTYLVALKLAQFDFLKEINKANPIMLLDDIFDKLDANRVKKIIELVAENHFGQIFITDKNLESLQNILNSIDIENRIFLIDDASNINLV